LLFRLYTQDVHARNSWQRTILFFFSELVYPNAPENITTRISQMQAFFTLFRKNGETGDGSLSQERSTTPLLVPVKRLIVSCENKKVLTFKQLEAL